MVKIGIFYIYKEGEVDHLLRYAKIDKEFNKKGISLGDITGGKLHLHRNPPKGLRKVRKANDSYESELSS